MAEQNPPSDDLVELYQAKLREFEGRNFGTYATFSSAAVRRQAESLDVRGPFSRDADRILHSFSYARYRQKTQVFFFAEHDGLSHRIVHVQLVAKLARFLGRVLDLNEDLCEAIALGHDIGHCPFAHVGEEILDALCQEHGIGHFFHNVQSIVFLDQIEKNGEGLNLTLQVLDGILAHNGELNEMSLRPDPSRDISQLDDAAINLVQGQPFALKPCTMEGCVVRMADTVSYVGRDADDAILLGIIQREDLPEEVTSVLGNDNRSIVNALNLDLIRHGLQDGELRYSNEIFHALKTLKQFNYEHIYITDERMEERPKLEHMFRSMFDLFLQHIESNNIKSLIFKDHINAAGPRYLESRSSAEVVRDFLAGMTDDYFRRAYKRLFVAGYKMPKT
ncbi:MAG TPA: HD domain-containing protein [Candidatus Lokiarchaeia archaeon]|nr:HD domain-containing protein [Candidatus Lokiarchaeia archaeon]